MRRLALISLIIFSFYGCDKKEIKENSNNAIEIPPPDVPIAKSDGNASIDSDFPPMPVVE
ncbi:hypothetical protein [Campylobacter lanienae]|uniref:hypothetical protein n=1 Tax=Campylobacter lanienae TaxID=75658 RepID=UPI002431EB38|nr:hypothetical protein [Campylobacter lanienae]